MQKQIDNLVENFLEETKGKNIRIISHFDTDGITSAAIMAKTLQRLDKTFSLSIVKQLEEDMIYGLPENEIILLLDLGSSSLEYFGKIKNKIFIIDHHEITSKTSENTRIINPHLTGGEEISGAGLTYLFSKSISSQNKDLANLAIIGMVGDMLGQNISRINNGIVTDSEVIIKRGLLLYPSTRPIHKTLEFSSGIFIPGVTGNSRGVVNFLKEIGIEKNNGEYKSLIELNEEETSKLITGILLRRAKKENSDIIGNIYLVKFFNRLEDARELSAMINACSRLDYKDIALSLCMGDKKARQKAESIYASYKQHLVSALNYVANTEKIEGKGYIIINAKNEIKDTIIGTVASILASSFVYEEGTIIVTMAYSDDKIKASARVCGREGRNVREILANSLDIKAECGGHSLAAGCLIPRDYEATFIKNLKKQLDIELVKV